MTPATQTMWSGTTSGFAEIRIAAYLRAFLILGPWICLSCPPLTSMLQLTVFLNPYLKFMTQCVAAFNSIDRYTCFQAGHFNRLQIGSRVYLSDYRKSPTNIINMRRKWQLLHHAISLIDFMLRVKRIFPFVTLCQHAGPTLMVMHHALPQDLIIHSCDFMRSRRLNN